MSIAVSSGSNCLIGSQGDSSFSNCSILEAIDVCEETTGNEMNRSYTNNNGSNFKSRPKV